MSSLNSFGFAGDIFSQTNSTSNDNGDPDGFAHYVHEDDMMNGLVFGKPAIALCGKIWVPERDGSEFPMCSECDEVFNSYFGSE